MQARAIFEAAASMQDQGVTVIPEIMVPLVGTPQELGHQVDVIRKVAKKVFAEKGHTVSYKVGTMIEIPRAALIADEVNVTRHKMCFRHLKPCCYLLSRNLFLLTDCERGGVFLVRDKRLDADDVWIQ